MTGAPSRSRTVRQFGSFVLIGCVNTAVYLGVYASLNRWIPYLTAHVIGYVVSIVCSFLLNSYVTCRTRPTWHAFVRYPLSAWSTWWRPAHSSTGRSAASGWTRTSRRWRPA